MQAFSKKINELNEDKIYPFHMPGHKRSLSSDNPYLIDITEIDGYDNLHNPKGMIADLEKRISNIYKSDKSYVLVNGSTCGILAAISAVTNYGDAVLMARNSHKSAYNAVCLRGLRVDYVYPEYISEPGMNGCISVKSVADMLEGSSEKNTKYKVVYITSPTYEGIVSDIEGIAKKVHEYGALLIVDEAHGAHFGLSREFPKSAVSCNADIVIQSIHKTLMGMTQTAILHASKSAPIEKLEYYLRVYQSSSPSYVLMSSIDACIGRLEEDIYNSGQGQQELWGSYRHRLNKVYDAAIDWRDIAIYTPKQADIVDKNKVFDFDCGKLVIYSRSGMMSGKQLYDILREKYRLQLEMSLGEYCLAMTSCMDSDEGFERLIKALSEIDGRLVQEERLADKEKPEHSLVGEMRKAYNIIGQQHTESVCTIAEAFEGNKEEKELAENMVAADYGYVYPPGIPFIVPGERVTNEIICDIIKAEDAGYEVHGVDFRNGRPYMKVLINPQ